MFKLFGFKRKQVRQNKNFKVDKYVNDINQQIADSKLSTNVVVILVYEDQITVSKIVDRLSKNGYRATMNKYHDNGFEIGIFL